MIALLLLVLLAGDPALTIDLGNGVKLEAVRVGSGTYTQGSGETESGREADEVQREVTLTKDFYIGKTPVQKRQFERFVAETGYRTDAEKGGSGGSGVENGKLVQRKAYSWRNPGYAQAEDQPVVVVTFADALAFSEWLSRKSGYTVRLPSEAEWESASQKAKELMLTDMLGVVNQWCSDWYAPWTDAAVTDPLVSTPGDSPRRVLRGGSFLRDKRRARSASRYQNSPGSRNADNGFRVVVESAAKAAPVAAPGGSSLDASQDSSQGSDSGNVILGFAILAIGFGISAFVLFIIVRALRRALGGSTRTLSGVTVESQSDGFTLVTTLPLGTRVRVSYRPNGGATVKRPVLLEFERTFVFTGEKPTHIQVLKILGESASGLVTVDGPKDEDDRDDDDRGGPSNVAVIAAGTWEKPRAY